MDRWWPLWKIDGFVCASTGTPLVTNPTPLSPHVHSTYIATIPVVPTYHTMVVCYHIIVNLWYHQSRFFDY